MTTATAAPALTTLEARVVAAFDDDELVPDGWFLSRWLAYRAALRNKEGLTALWRLDTVGFVRHFEGKWHLR